MQNKNAWAITVEPLEPFERWLGWVRSTTEIKKVSKNKSLNERTVVLIPQFFTRREADSYIDAIWDDIFKCEMARHADRTLWINYRTRDLFRAWFRLEFHPVVYTTLMADQ